MTNSTIKEYFEALERIKRNVPINIPKNSSINKDTVALEAGRKRGSIRNRPGFEKLLREIESASEIPQSQTKKRIPLNPSQTAEIQRLKRDLDVARSRYMSLLYLNAEMAKSIRKSGGEVRRFGEVVDITVDPKSTDVPF